METCSAHRVRAPLSPPAVVIIATWGYGNSGKSTIAEYLTEKYGFVELSIADVIRDFLVALDPYTTPGNRWSEILDRYGYVEAKQKVPEFRAVMQRAGDEAVEAIGCPQLWINLCLERMAASDGEHFLFSSTRRTFEAEAVRSHGGHLWHVYRPGCGPANDHRNEIELADYPHWDWTVVNDGTIEDLHDQVDNAVRAAQWKEEGVIADGVPESSATERGLSAGHDSVVAAGGDPRPGRRS